MGQSATAASSSPGMAALRDTVQARARRHYVDNNRFARRRLTQEMAMSLPAPVTELLTKLAVPVDQLDITISEGRIIGLEDSEGNVTIKGEDGHWLHYSPPPRDGEDGGVRLHDPEERRLPLWLRHPDRAYHHLPVYGETGIRVRISGGVKEFTLREFLAEFPSIILFVVPLYSAHVYGGPRKDVQDSIKKFAVDFGRRAGQSVVVFDHWVREEFDLAQYEKQLETVLATLGIPEKELPALLVSNRSPFSWDPSDPERRAVLLTFRDIDPDDMAARLTSIAADLRRLQLPNRWGHRWSRLRSWSRKNGVLGAVLGVLTGG